MVVVSEESDRRKKYDEKTIETMAWETLKKSSTITQIQRLTNLFLLAKTQSRYFVPFALFSRNISPSQTNKQNQKKKEENVEVGETIVGLFSQ